MTTSPPWLQIPTTVPINGVAYWVTQYRWASKPFIAVWIEASQEWEVDILAWRYPWYVTPWFRIQ